MNRYFLLLLLFCTHPGEGRAQKAFTFEQKQLQAVVTELFSALSALNADKARSVCTPDLTILESGAVWNFDSLALRINTRKLKPGGFTRINKFDFIETKSAGETAWLSYFNEAVITSAGKTVTVRWLESVVLVRVNQEWKINLLHSTELSRTP